MNEHIKNSPFPWVQHLDSQGTSSTLIVSTQDEGRGIVACLGPHLVAQANAALIVKAVNSHQALIDALEAAKAILQQLFDQNYPVQLELNMAIAALAQAREK